MAAGSNDINVIGAREHNLKSVSVRIPKTTLTVITGPSGSGKSSLALDTLYAEGRRRYVESLSSYARQFLGVSKRPDVDRIDGLCPAISIEQKTVGFNPRSTVGTVTEIYDYIRLLFARVGVPHCPICGAEVREESPDRIAKMVREHYSDKQVIVAAPVAVDRKGEFVGRVRELFERGFQRFLIDGKRYRFTVADDINRMALKRQDRHTIYVLIDSVTAAVSEAARVQEAVERAFEISKGLCSLIDTDGNVKTYSSARVCLNCVRSCPELEPRLFSFNSPMGACATCHGLGFEYQGETVGEQEWVDQAVVTCRSCHGARLNAEALSVRIAGKNIFELCSLSVRDAHAFFSELKLDGERAEIAHRIVTEILNRLSFLANVGLSYLTIGRSVRTLSGGEGQRIRLATQIGSALSGVLYILDEPSIGLHQRDNQRLIDTLKALRDQGNTVVVVEHDEETIREADFVVDMGPGAGTQGGHITAVGSPTELAKNEQSLTGSFLSGRRAIKLPVKRREPIGYLKLHNVSTNNLKHLDVAIPLGVFCAISGVSGSGKSSLIIQTLAPALVNHFQRGFCVAAGVEEIEGIDQLSNVVLVDQSPIGRTPRSNPATYLGIFDSIRELFAGLPESNLRGYQVGRFSFNVPAGQCFECRGEGELHVSMHFLEDVTVTCRACKGKRYNEQTLEIRYNGKTIADVLEMTVAEALKFFEAFPLVAKKLRLLSDVGLDYLTLGQPSTTLSGGEAQRIKLVNELAKRGSRTMYILDEPTTGLHSCDVEKLLEVLNRLVDRGNSVVVIEHNLDLLKSADYLLDIGPEGGDAGGELVACGTPEEVAACDKGHTAKYLKKSLNQQQE